MTAVSVPWPETTVIPGSLVQSNVAPVRLVDAVNGAIVWKARHQVQESYLFIRPDMRDLATKLATDMIKYMPPEKR